MSETATGAPLLVSIIELGGYPDFTPLYQRLGVRVRVETNMRKALALLRREVPRVVVAEFNYQSDFRDRTSSLESMLATLQPHPGVRVIVLYEPEYAHQLRRLTDVHRVHACLPFPIDEARLEEAVSAALAD